ncbi:MAG: hypothetical protein CEN91_418, partial [Candidatus Berkelbacteria bacterium Licking1014_85]
MANQEQENLITSPADYIAEFEKSPEYLKALRNRLREARLKNPQITKWEMQEAFEETENYKYLLGEWHAKGHELLFDPNIYSRNFLFKLQRYWDKIKESRAKEKYFDREELMEIDREKIRLHIKAGEQLEADKMAPNFTIARMLVHLLTCNQGYDSYDPYRDENRREVIKGDSFYRSN